MRRKMKSAIKEHWAIYAMECACEDKRPTVLGFIARMIEAGYAIMRCRILGHDFEDEGYANPDSGAIIMVCQRCGLTHRHRLY